MINILKEILLDFQEMPLATGVPRRMGLTPVAGKASVCIGVQRENLNLILEAYYSLYPEKKQTEKVYFFFDEIQAIAGWEPFVERLIINSRCPAFPIQSICDANPTPKDDK